MGKSESSVSRNGSQKILKKSKPTANKLPAGRDKRKARPVSLAVQAPPRFKPGKDGKAVEFDPEMNLENALALTRAFGTEELDLMWHFMNQLTGSVPDLSSPAAKLNRMVPILHGLRPGDALETMIIVQLIAVHNCILECLRQALHPNQVPAGIEANIHRVTALTKVFIGLVKALQKYRGQESKQQVVVKHIHVHEGGKALVGVVNHRSKKGGGDEKKD